ncbi:MAG: diguanylate cyclase [Desulfurivibrio sp.]|nr:diguanylate cyclase [Desulfurivibrio sp.]
MTLAEHSTATLLIVEDDPVSRRILAAAAEDEGFTVNACPDAESGWEFFEQQQPWIVVLDWRLGDGLDGVGLARKIRASDSGHYVTILMVTVQERPEDMEEALKAGVTYYMTKPIKRGYFQAWLGAARKISDDMWQLREHHRAEERYRRELESLNAQLEKAVGRANEMAAEASQAYIEINQIFKTVAGGIFLVDTQFNLLRFNEAFRRMTGFSAVKVENAKCYEVFCSQRCGTSQCPFQLIKQGEQQVQFDIERQGADGESFYYHVLATPFKGPAGDLLGLVEHITDITPRVLAEKALQKSEQRYKKLSIVDELTGLFNKRYFNKHLRLEAERARRYHHPLSLLIMDIDNFKHYNDTYGHPAGDRVLTAVGGMLRESMRLNDLACRFGGEEFVVILPMTDGATALKLAERLREQFAALEFQPLEGVVIRKTMSIGVAQFADEESPESLLARADKNLYAAKAAGRDRSICR